MGYRMRFPLPSRLRDLDERLEQRRDKNRGVAIAEQEQMGRRYFSTQRGYPPIFFKVGCTHKSGDVLNFITVAC